MVFISVVSRRTGVSVDDILSQKRNMGIVRIRAQIALILRKNMRLSYPEIGSVMGRDHSSVMKLIKKTSPIFSREEVLDMESESNSS